MTARPLARAILLILFALSVNVSAEAASITLEWDRNPESDVQGYVISYGTASRAYRTEVNVGNQTSFTFTLNPGTPTTYYFVVQAYNAISRSGYSAEVSTTVAPTSPVLTIDRPLQDSVLPGDMLLSGWAIDRASTSGPGVNAVHVYAYPAGGGAATFLGVASYGAARGDVAAAFGPQFVNSGYSLPIPHLAPGVWDIAFYARSTVENAFNIVRTRRVTVYDRNSAPPPSNTVVTIDMPTSFSSVGNVLSVGGWAIDTRPSTGTGVNLVQVWAYPNPGNGQQPFVLGNAQYGRLRNDIAAAFGNIRYRNSGFQLDVPGMQPGVYDIVTMARNTINGAIDTTRVTRVTVDPTVLIVVDNPVEASMVPGTFTIGGWTLDRRSANGIGIDALHVYAYPVTGAAPIFVSAVIPGSLRSDVAAVYGTRYRNSGFNFTVAGLAPGTYDIVLYAHSSVTQVFENIRVLRVTVR
jgi:hypothetical protein